jgi:uncharacterized protein DUF4382
MEDSMKRFNVFTLFAVLVLGVSVILSACGGGSSSDRGGTSQGTVNLSLTDAPGDFDHVYVTVKDVWFHTSDTAGPRAADWRKYPLATPVIVDLLTLANGTVQSFWNNIHLPVATFKQIRIFLVPTFDASLPAGQYHNYVVIGSNTYPLHIPDADDGIQLIGTFGVTAGGTLRLAIDFDAGHDVVEFQEGTDYVLKPRLTCYDLDHAGAITGALSTGGSFTTAPHFVIKAERLATAEEMLASGSTSTYHVIRRWTVPRPDGSFILSPVSTLETTTWDVVIRGLNYKTLIIKGVPITLGGSTNLGTIAMSPSTSSDYPVAGTIAAPTGAWVQFYQTLQAPGEYPYEIRFRHFNPLWGGFKQTFMLNDDQIQLASYVSDGVLSTLTATTPAEGIGEYQAFAGACLFNRSSSTPAIVSSSTVTVQFPNPLTVMSPYQGNSVSGMISLGTTTAMNTMMLNKMDSGLLFAVNGGMIVDAIRVNSQMATGGTYTISDLPGGTPPPGTPLPGAFYGIDAFGWSSTNAAYVAVAIPWVVDLSEGDGNANIEMLPLW